MIISSSEAASGAVLTRGSVRPSYQVIAPLDSGGMADVHLALAQGLAGAKKLVVTKRLRSELASEEDYVAMFLEEGRLATRFRHPNVVHTYEVCENGGTWFIAMEFLEGQSLSRLRKKARAHGGIPLAIHLKILSEALVGLDYAHELTDDDGTPLRIVHRDMNPQNIFIGYDGQVKILDFGIAKTAASAVDTRAGLLKGKLAYMAPEHVCGEPVDRRADLFSVGVMVWEAVTGRRYWAGAEEVTILRRIVGDDLPGLTGDPAVPSGVMAICEKALTRQPEGRFARATEMRMAIDAYLERSDTRVDRREIGGFVSALFSEQHERLKKVAASALPPPLMPRAPVTARWRKRRWMTAATMGGGVLLLGAVGNFTRGGATSSPSDAALADAVSIVPSSAESREVADDDSLVAMVNSALASDPPVSDPAAPAFTNGTRRAAEVLGAEQAPATSLESEAVSADEAEREEVDPTDPAAP